MNPASPTTDTVSVYFNDAKKHETEFDGSVDKIEVNGNRINDIHDLTIEVARNGRTIRHLAVVCTVLATLCLGLILYAGIDRRTLGATRHKETSDQLSELKKDTDILRKQVFKLHLVRLASHPFRGETPPKVLKQQITEWQRKGNKTPEASK